MKLDWPPEPGAVLMAGGLGRAPSTCRHGSRTASCWPAGLSCDRLGAAAELARAGSGDPDVEVVYSLITAAGPDARARADASLAEWGLSADPSRTAAGDPEDIAAAIRRSVDAGATTVVLQPTADLTDVADVVALVELVGREVRPLLD